MSTKKTHLAFLLGLAGTVAACSDATSGPKGPTIPHDANGAVQSATNAVTAFDNALGDYVLATGLFTDELTAGNKSAPVMLDQRQLGTAPSGDPTGSYTSLQNARVTADLAARAITRYAPTNALLRGQSYALEGYTELMLADLFCSGVPLSTIDLDSGRVIYAAGTPRDSIYQSAIIHFDTALSALPLNDSRQTLAKIGKGRALLALGQFTEAAAVVADIPDGTYYQSSVGFHGSQATLGLMGIQGIFTNDRVADREGTVGLAYRSSLDPRTLVVRATTDTAAGIPNKYATTDSIVKSSGLTAYTHYVLADWIEARLIQAEAALRANNTTSWLQILNHLRATATVAPPATPYHDTPITLTPLADPGTSTARIDTMFAERAAWLFLTGHRQGDLRRLIRQYSRTQAQVYPTGAYALGGTYGTDVTTPVPSSDEQSNPKFKGCIDHLP